jgi:hypothetical protein
MQRAMVATWEADTRSEFRDAQPLHQFTHTYPFGKTRPVERIRMGVSRNTVKKYLTQPQPKYGPRQVRRQPVRELVLQRILALLAQALAWTDGKQRLTATRLHRMRRDEGHQVGVTLVRRTSSPWRGSLPADYREFLLAKDGGKPKPCGFVFLDRTGPALKGRCGTSPAVRSLPGRSYVASCPRRSDRCPNRWRDW